MGTDARAPGRERHVLDGHEVQAGVAVVGPRRQHRGRVQAADAEPHGPAVAADPFAPPEPLAAAAGRGPSAAPSATAKRA